MNFLEPCWRRVKAGKLWFLTGATVLLVTAAAGSAERLHLLPQLRPGETLRYDSHARLVRRVKTQSNVATMLQPGDLRRDLSTGVRLSIQEMQLVDKRPIVAAETELAPQEQPSAENAAAKPLKVSFTIGKDGGLTRADGLDDLDAEQRLSWQFWVSQFAFAWTLPPAGVKLGEKWKSIEEEKTPTPISKLEWERETTYVENDACPVLPAEPCAVFLTDANLKQKSNPKDATPEDYALNHLKTSGSARGKNETVLYLSLKTGLLMRATEDVQQSLDVTIAKADESNGVRYQIDVTSHFEALLVPAQSNPAP